MNVKEVDIVRMAREVGINNDCDGIWCNADQLKRFAELVAAHEREECIQNVLQQYEGFGTEHQGVEYVKQRIVEAIRARSKA
jgi:F0F1-type ATP synthase delta subunit